MAKLHIYYRASEGKELEENLKIKIDDTTKLEVAENKEVTVDLITGKHEIKMYIPYLSGSFGYTTETIEIQKEDVFYYYKPPVMYNQKGKFIKVQGLNGFQTVKKKQKIVSAIFTTIAIVIIIWALFF